MVGRSKRVQRSVASATVDEAFKGLDVGVPLLLLPVRIETVFTAAKPERADGSKGRAASGPRQLLVRIYPDEIHADTLVRALTLSERTLAQRFWTRSWSATSTRERQDRAFAKLAARLGPFRAAWALEATRPDNWDRRGRGAQGRAPRFGEPPKDDPASPGIACLLPDRWIVTGYQRDEHLFTQVGKPIPRALAITPNLVAMAVAPKTVAELLGAQGLGWTQDFDAAEAVGMALRIDLARRVDLDAGVDLFVVGAHTAATPEDAARQLAELLAAHHWTRGLDFVRRGTPTNNSDRANSGVSLVQPDLPALLDSVLARAAPLGRVDAPIHRRRFDAAASLALGLEPGSILERVPLRDDAQLDLAAAMNAALWPALWGYFLRTMLGDALDETWSGWLRAHFIACVKPGGLLPTIRVGSQPYALLPVAQEQERDSATDRIDQLENLLLGLTPAWQDAVDQRVARLDGDVPDAPAEGAGDSDALGMATATLARILGATPNPSDLMLTPVTDQVELYKVRWGLLVFLLDIAISPSFPTISSQLGADLAAAATLEAQINVFQALISSGDASTPLPAGALWLEAHSANEARQAAQKALDLIEGYVLPLLYNHRDRVAPVLERGVDRAQVTGVMADDADPPLFFSLFGESQTRLPWTGPRVARDGADAAEVRVWLEALALEARDASQPANPPGAHAPLLFQLLKRSIAVAHDSDRADLRAGLQVLAAAAADGRMVDPIVDLELLMDEVLGTCMHRLDAWLSAGAVDRLEAARRDRPRGISIGGFGWVLGARPSSASEPSQGFIHAPSLDHAATAAILRSGWSALGDGALGVDVSSARARTASWIVDGVRDGYRLGELLGQSLERRLHDSFLDRWIEPVRSAVLTGTGRRGEQPVAIVDGFVVARAWLGGSDLAPLTAEEDKVRDELGTVAQGAGDDETKLRTALDLHAAELDAVADASLFQSVHAIVRGNADRAAASFAATGDTASAPPPLTALRTARSGQHVTHRIVVLLDPAQATAGATSPAALAEPVLDAWIATALPLERIGFGAWVEEGGVKSWQGVYTLASAGLGSLEFLADLPPGDAGTGGSALTRRLAWTLEREAAAVGRRITVTIDTELDGGDGGDKLPLALALAAAHSLRALVHAGRALKDADLAATELESTADEGSVGSRADNLIDAARDAALRLRTAIDGGAATAELLDACASLAAWQIPGAMPRAGLADLASGGDSADREALRIEADAIHARLQLRLDAHNAVRGNDLASSLARMQALLPGSIVLPPIEPAGIDTLRVVAGRSGARLGGAEQAIPWLHKAGRVRTHAQTAAVAVDLVEAALGETRFQPTLIQLPDHEDEGWAATSLPAHDAALRTCILSLTKLPDSASLAGLAIDAWTEVIPDTHAASGIAVHFDAPSARAPQGCLLATPPRSKTWTHASVLALVRQTLQRTRQRAAGPNEIEGYGQYLPAAYLADTTEPGPMRTRESAP